MDCVYDLQVSDKKVVAIFNNPDHKLHEICVDFLTQFLKVAFSYRRTDNFIIIIADSLESAISSILRGHRKS